MRQLDKNRPVCPQICELLCVDIVGGAYDEERRLPSVRELAADLGVNPNTVQKAYVLLEEKGLICSLPKKGAFVTYSGDALGNISDTRRANAVKTVHELKEQGITLDELNEIIREVFTND